MRRVLVGLALMVVLTAAWSAGGSKTFHEKGFTITFKYPSSFVVARSVKLSASAGSAAVGRKAVALDSDNLILVSRFNLRISVTSSNVNDVRGEVDRLFGKLAGKPMHGKRITLGGLPGYEYRFALDKPRQGLSRIEVLFDRKIEYTVNCQSTPKRRAELDAGCRQALATLRRV